VLICLSGRIIDRGAVKLCGLARICGKPGGPLVTLLLAANNKLAGVEFFAAIRPNSIS